MDGQRAMQVRSVAVPIDTPFLAIEDSGEIVVWNDCLTTTLDGRDKTGIEDNAYPDGRYAVAKLFIDRRAGWMTIRVPKKPMRWFRRWMLLPEAGSGLLGYMGRRYFGWVREEAEWKVVYSGPFVLPKTE